MLIELSIEVDSPEVLWEILRAGVVASGHSYVIDSWIVIGEDEDRGAR